MTIMSSQPPLKVLLLAGGVGGAKAAEGLVHAQTDHEISVLGKYCR